MSGQEPGSVTRRGEGRSARRRGRRRAVMVSVPLLVLFGALGGAAFIPKVANRVGYALPGEKGLPYRVHYNDRDYRSDVTCAGARWCEDDRTPGQAGQYCTSRAGLDGGRGNSGTELVKVDDVFTLFGPAHPVYTAGVVPRGQTATTIVVEASAGCFLTYALMGGP
ncbi:hypothetical protein [Amycolatopsis pittospori]|uniref:hypothetical protein n=1 Tax=Amycolatopsis pittospori TaxID=2749434 RepID=UPI001F349715|nr:hypothetical protein [Amycolatopsis pittospori]